MARTVRQQRVELWLPVVGWEDLYSVSDYGNVWSHHGQGQILKPTVDSRGYLKVSLSRNSKITTARVHTLVLTAFDKPCPPGLECCHGVFGQQDNHLYNLRWDTHLANMHEMFEDGFDIRTVSPSYRPNSNSQPREA